MISKSIAREDPPETASRRPPRRRQQDRRAETRLRLIEATIACLYRGGYGATSISDVAEEAGLSRSVIGYHFPAKADLMVAVRDHVWRLEMEELERQRAELPPRELLRQTPRLLLAGMRRPEAMAVNEIMLAARGDPTLRAKLAATERAIDEDVMARQPALFTRAGLPYPADFANTVQLTSAAVRGLAITELATGDSSAIEACIALYSALMEQHLGLAEADDNSRD